MSSMPSPPAWSALTAPPSHPPLPPKAMAVLAQAALFQARRNLGQTWPNPSVGAVVADPLTGEIIASAPTGVGGRPHAEVLALTEAGHRAKGALLFTTLEPCSHFGATPPCANAIIEAGIAAVIYGSVDPDPRVSGRGLALLQLHRIAAVRGAFAGEADWLNLGHALRVTSARPFVQIKLAVDSNGRVAQGDGHPVWVTGEEARAQAHLLRARADAILVGRNTIEQDDPALTCRLPGLERRSPVRVVLSSQCQLPPASRILLDKGPPLWLFCSNTRKTARTSLDGKNVEAIAVQSEPLGKPDLRAVLAALAQKGITRLLVEGGPTVAKAFLDARLVDEVVVMRGSQPAASERVMLPFLDSGLERLTESPLFKKISGSAIGSDAICVYRSCEHWQS